MLQVRPEGCPDQIQQMDGWLRLVIPDDLLGKIKIIRARMRNVLVRRLSHPTSNPALVDQAIVDVVARVIWQEMQQLPGMTISVSDS